MRTLRRHTKENMIISKAARDANPCKASEKKDNGDAVFISDLANDIITTSKPLSPTQTPASNTKDKPSTPSAVDVTGECAQSIPAAQRPPRLSIDIASSCAQSVYIKIAFKQFFYKNR